MREQGSEDRGWSVRAVDLGIVAIAVITLTMAWVGRKEQTRREIDDTIHTWQGVYHITSPLPLPTGWNNEARLISEPLQWDCELIDVDVDVVEGKKTPTSREIQRGRCGVFLVYIPGASSRDETH